MKVEMKIERETGTEIGAGTEPGIETESGTGTELGTNPNRPAEPDQHSGNQPAGDRSFGSERPFQDRQSRDQGHGGQWAHMAV